MRNPCTTIHDSYIVERHRFADLRTAMTMAAIRVAGYDLFAEQDDIEVDRSLGYASEDFREQYESLPTPNAHKKYKKRFAEWKLSRNP